MATYMAVPAPRLVPRCESRCAQCAVRDQALCAALGDDELELLSGIGRLRTVPRGTVIAWAGDENGLCANVVSGALKVTASTADGREQAVGLMFEGDFVGQPFASSSDLNTVALVETELCVYPRSAFERLLGEQPRLERALLERTLASLNQARERQLTLARKSARERVAGFLLDLAERSGASFDVPISRGELAEYLGLTIETVSRQFSHLRSAGMIEVEKGGRLVRVRDLAALEAAAEA